MNKLIVSSFAVLLTVVSLVSLLEAQVAKESAKKFPSHMPNPTPPGGY